MIYHLNFLLVYQQYIKHYFQVLDFYGIMKINIHFVVKIPFNLDIHNLIDDLRNFSWEAAEILLYYSKMLKEEENKRIL